MNTYDGAIRPAVEAALFKGKVIVIYGARNPNIYFWRTYDRYELDYVEEEGGRLIGYECKWTEKRWQAPALFDQTYPGSESHLVHRDNYLDFLT